jgi:5-formyltetrahydrofolate cyclo-ligase
MLNKSDLRKQAIDCRKSISVDDRKEAAELAAKILAKHPIFQTSHHIACYMAKGSEFDTNEIIRKIWQANKQCYLPTLQDQKKLKFAQYDEQDELQPNHLGILEPKDAAKKIEANKLDVTILPLTAYDLKGNRLGAGAGYYDRTFSFKHHHPHKKPFLIGLAFETQQFEEILNDDWDVCLDAILTERKLIFFK